MNNTVVNLPNEERYKGVFKTKPFDHQFAGFELSKDRITFAYFMEMGTGKTKLLIDNASYLYMKGNIDAVVVLAPKSVYRNWVGEFEKHCAVDYVICYYAAYMNRIQEYKYARFLEVTDKLKVFLVNVEAMSGANGPRVLLPFMKRHRVLMAVDESTVIKNISAARTKATIDIGKYAKYRRILTGQPVANSPMDFFAQCAFLDKRHLGINSFTAFKARYAVQRQMILGPRRFMRIEGYQRLDELQTKIKQFSYRVSKKECLDLPPKIPVRREVELTPEQVSMYKQMSKLAVLELETGDVTATVVMAKLEKLHQIVCGHVKTDLGVTTRLKNNRVDEVIHILEEVEGKVIVWCAYQEDVRLVVEAIANEYGADVVAAYYGNTSQDDREQIRINFQNPAHKLRVIVATAATGKYGTTLTQAGTSIYYSNTHNLENRLQSEDRNHRIGSNIHESIVYIDLVTPNTVDDIIIDNLTNKRNLADQIADSIENKSWKKLFILD